LWRRAGGAAFPRILGESSFRCEPWRRCARITPHSIGGVTFRWKDYRATGRTRNKTITLEAPEFMRRFLLHVLPGGFHPIRLYGLLANPVRRQNLARIRPLLHTSVVVNASDDASPDTRAPIFVCRHCGAPIIIIEILLRSQPIRAPSPSRGNA
jgi:hypothetical protein